MHHPTPVFAWRSKFSGFLYKLDPNEPSKTLVAQQGKYDGPFHWNNRKLNINELIRIQGFPKNYIFKGSKISIQKQIGNSVAPKMGRALAQAVKNQVFGFKSKIELIRDIPIIKRSLKKRVSINNRNISKSINVEDLELFRVDWKNSKSVYELINSGIKVSCVQNEGVLNLSASIKQEIKTSIKISLNFSESFTGEFKKIECEFFTADPLDFNLAWDCIHRTINNFTSYEDLGPLFGHFTEPYPKFDVALSFDKLDCDYISFFDWMTNYKNLSKTHDANILTDLFGKKTSFKNIVALLRGRYVDIRVNETNRTIPKNQFRICYPFTIPTWRPTFTRYLSKGLHPTADIDLKKLLKSS
jgi:DNA (cytosine-5)-methyltransferase 1